MPRYLNTNARSWTAPRLERSPRAFHRSLPGYAPTPLVEIPGLASELGAGRVFVKDESSRLGLPAFKILGASFAVARALSARLGEREPLPLDELRARLAGSGLTLTAATDGNHGRAVARAAAWAGLRAVVSVPPGVSEEARAGIVAEGAELVELDLAYDDVVRRVAEEADEQTVLVQDTSWEGYEEVPGWIVDGYDTMLAETDAQLAGAGVDAPDLVLAPAGVGSFAQAVVAHYRRDGHRPAVVAVEPDTAASVTAALEADRIVPVETGDTIMTGLNCGTVSEIAWPVLREGLDAAETVTDREALDAVHQLAGFGVDSGPCGAATLAAARRLLSSRDRRELLGLTSEAVVVLLSTEGRAANPKTLP